MVSEEKAKVVIFIVLILTFFDLTKLFFFLVTTLAFSYNFFL